MKVLVVGGAGYIGGAVVDVLLKWNDHDFTVFDNLLYEDSYRKEVDFIFGDVRDQDKLLSVLKDYDAVIWLAAIVGDGACANNPGLAIAINQNAVGWLAEHFQGRVIFTSTCSVYGAHDQLLNEESETNPLSIYAVTKYEAELLLGDKKATIFRLGTLYGIGDLFSRVRMDLVVNTLTYKACVANKVHVFGKEQYRPLLHVRDAARTIVEALDSKQHGIFNLAECNIKIIDLVKMVKSCFPTLEVEEIEVQHKDARNYKVDISKAKKFLNFKAKENVLKGIFEVRELIISNRIRNIYSKRYLNAEFVKERM